MNTEKHKYLDEIRTNTAYPTYRGIIGLIAFLGYILAGLNAFGALISGLMTMGDSFLAGLGILIVGAVVSALIFLMAKFWKEAALILVDIGDSVTEANARATQ